MSDRNDGKSAFPARTPVMGPHDKVSGALKIIGERIERGMTLRDYFAGQAMINYDDPGTGDELHIAKGCYIIADAMLKARGEPPCK